jgi:hypothetical protein
MFAVFPEYVMLPDSVGAANCFSKVCATDAALSRPDELAIATTTIFTVSVNGTVMVAVNELMELVTPDTTELSDAFRTCTSVTPAATVYVMLAVFPEYVTELNVGAVNCCSNDCWADGALARLTELANATTTMFGAFKSVNGTVRVALVPDAMEDASAGTTFTYEIVPTKFSLVSLIHPPSVTGPLADMM